MRSRWHHPARDSLLRLMQCAEQNPNILCIPFSTLNHPHTRFSVYRPNSRCPTPATSFQCSGFAPLLTFFTHSQLSVLSNRYTLISSLHIDLDLPVY